MYHYKKAPLTKRRQSMLSNSRGLYPVRQSFDLYYKNTTQKCTIIKRHRLQSGARVFR